MTAVLVGALVAGAVVAGWPDRPARDRLFERRIDLSLLRRVAAEMTAGPSGRAAAALAGVAALAGLPAGGPVAAVVAGAYAGLGGREWVRRAARRRAVAGRIAALDGLGSMVADLRAGVPPTVVAGGLGPPATRLGARATSPGALPTAGSGAPAAGRSGALMAGTSGAPAAAPSGATAAGSTPHTGPAGDERIDHLVAAVWRLAEQTGAPAADLLDRIESDARAADRAAASAAAQAAGAQATAVLLAALPLGGIGLGYAIGADPLEVLLRTPLGAACAIAAVLLQCGGLQWSQRLTGGAGR